MIFLIRFGWSVGIIHVLPIFLAIISPSAHLFLMLPGENPHLKREQWLEGIRAEARIIMGEWVAQKDRYVILDTETTGLDSDAEIIELPIIDLDENILFNSLIRQENPVTAEAIAVHGISDDMLVGAPVWPSVWTKIKRILRALWGYSHWTTPATPCPGEI